MASPRPRPARGSGVANTGSPSNVLRGIGRSTGALIRSSACRELLGIAIEHAYLIKPCWALAQPKTAVLHGYEREGTRRGMGGSSSLIAQTCAIGMVRKAPITTNEPKAQLLVQKRRRNGRRGTRSECLICVAGAREKLQQANPSQRWEQPKPDALFFEEKKLVRLLTTRNITQESAHGQLLQRQLRGPATHP